MKVYLQLYGFLNFGTESENLFLKYKLLKKYFISLHYGDINIVTFQNVIDRFRLNNNTKYMQNYLIVTYIHRNT